MRFETDGIRGAYPRQINDGVAYNLGLAVGALAKGQDVVVGGDTRESTPELSAYVQGGLYVSRAAIRNVGVLPTPGIAYASTVLDTYAVAITASHNPYTDNGIKVFAPGGKKIDDSVARTIEEQIGITRRQPKGKDREAPLDKQLREEYENYLLHSAGDTRPFLDMTFVVDSANGAGYEIGPRVLRRLGAEVMSMASLPDGRNINRECGAAYKDKSRLLGMVKRYEADAGITLDGDADRVMLITPEGRVLDGDRIMYILAVHAKQNGRNIPAVVGTHMSNIGFEVALREQGIDLIRADVGDRFVSEKLDEHALPIGGEQAGHVILKDYAHSGDGILTAIQTMRAVRELDKSLDEWAEAMIDYPQVLVNIPGVNKRRVRNKEVLEAVASVQEVLGENGSVNVRASGTEPLVRVMVQAADRSEEEVAGLATHLETVIRSRA